MTTAAIADNQINPFAAFSVAFYHVRRRPLPRLQLLEMAWDIAFTGREPLFYMLRHGA